MSTPLFQMKTVMASKVQKLTCGPMSRVRYVREHINDRHLMFISLKRGLPINPYDIFLRFYSSTYSNVRGSPGKKNDD